MVRRRRQKQKKNCRTSYEPKILIAVPRNESSQIPQFDKATLKKIIIDRIAGLSGNSFQDFCNRLCSKLHPGDYQPLRAGGQGGDENNDGYCPEARIFYAAFGTRGQTIPKIKNKIKGDLLGCLKKQVDVKIWRFLTNDDKFVGEIEKFIDQDFRRNKKFRKKYPKIKIEAWVGERLAEILIKFDQIEIYEILDMSPPNADSVTVGQWSETNERTKKIEKIVKSLKAVNAGALATPAKAATTPNKPSVDAQNDDVSRSKYKSELDTAKSLLDKEEFKASRKIYEKLLHDFESDSAVPQLIRFKVHNNLGSCFANIGENESAVFHFKKAYDLIGKSSVIACKNRALASSLEEKPAEGLSFINAAIELSPEDNGAINIKAMLLRESGRAEEALQLYQE